MKKKKTPAQIDEKKCYYCGKTHLAENWCEQKFAAWNETVAWIAKHRKPVLFKNKTHGRFVKR